MIATWPPIGPTLTEVAKLVDNGQIKPVVSLILPLEDIRKAHTLIEGRHARGKIALQVVP
jgi:NADPH:quinone reductase-like Zn-dependent oxidoreductase